jgi:hypothetical protein
VWWAPFASDGGAVCVQAHHFKAMMKRVENSAVKKESVVAAATELLVPRYQRALEQVSE